MKLSLNERVKFKLTEKGLEHYKAFYAGMKMAFSPKVDSLGYYKMPFWEFMHIFGPKMWIGNISMVEDNCVYIGEIL